MRRRWIADTYTPQTGHPTHAALLGDQALHLARVLRAEPGQIFDVVAGGFLHRAEILTVSPERVDFLLHEELVSDAALPLHLYLAIFKFDHFEWAVEKATELGIAQITPILARRTEKHLGQASAKRVERWRRIAHEASQQSRRTTIPTIAGPTPLQPALAQEQAPTRILLSETEQALTLAAALGDTNPGAPCLALETWDRTTSTPDGPITHALAIGPEGGWTPEEMSLFTQYNWTHVTLGPRILRAETAAIAAIAIAGTFLGRPAQRPSAPLRPTPPRYLSTMPDAQQTLIDKSTPEHDQPGDERGTDIKPGAQGITPHPTEESARQSKVVSDRQQPNS